MYFTKENECISKSFTVAVAFLQIVNHQAFNRFLKIRTLKRKNRTLKPLKPTLTKKELTSRPTPYAQIFCYEKHIYIDAKLIKTFLSPNIFKHFFKKNFFFPIKCRFYTKIL